MKIPSKGKAVVEVGTQCARDLTKPITPTVAENSRQYIALTKVSRQLREGPSRCNMWADHGLVYRPPFEPRPHHDLFSCTVVSEFSPLPDPYYKDLPL